MKIATYGRDPEQLSVLSRWGVTDVILEHRLLSRFGELSTGQVMEMAAKCRRFGIRPLLEWDLLMTEDVFQSKIRVIESLPLSEFAAIRVRDLGALYYIQTHYPNTKVQLLLETGYHNIEGIRRITHNVGNQLDRVVVSPEVPSITLAKYTKAMAIELLALGRILVFYTPRPLLSSMTPSIDLSEDLCDDGSIWGNGAYTLRGVVSSELTHHKGFRVIENDRGTYLFHTKDLFLLAYLPRMESIGVDTVRIDLRFGGEDLMASIGALAIDFSESKARELKLRYPHKTCHGFFNRNRTDAVFRKLKNQSCQRMDTDYIGEVVGITHDSSRSQHKIHRRRHPYDVATIVVSGNGVIRVGETVTAVTPDDRTITWQVTHLCDTQLEPIEIGKGDEIVMVNLQKGLTVKSQIYHAGEMAILP